MWKATSDAICTSKDADRLCVYSAFVNTSPFPKCEEDWLRIASGFESKWQFPHCLGAIDGKHIIIVPPKESGSFFFNYKKTNSVVLMAVANANYEFVNCDVGTDGRVSNGGVLQNTKFYKLLVNNSLKIPQPQRIANLQEIGLMEYVFVGDDAFTIHNDLMKPYRQEKLSKEERIFNYRLSRACRVVENTFGVLASRFRICHTAINLKLENIDTVVLTYCVLHNFLRRRNPQFYTPYESLDCENINKCSLELGERCDEEIMHTLQRGRSGQIFASAKTVRNKYKHFSTTGAVPWKDGFVS
ncbi:protein ALP1-like [Schistocerca americana]|uniref:protein ALP1-like n=1 Tax=Schistocerca americana TaxID=7009 RepID=UPI001F4F57CB|nr:protein ALP1-like [Schistocerca americana]